MIFGARIRIHFTITYLMQGGIRLHLTHVARRSLGRYYSMNFWYVSFGALTPGAVRRADYPNKIQSNIMENDTNIIIGKST
jgi:hypothetical protein